MSDSPALVGLDGHREDVGISYELLDVDEQRLGWISGVTGGSLDYSAASRIKFGGSIDMVDVDDIDWLEARLRVWTHVDDIEWPLGLYVPSVPKDAWSEGEKSWTVELLGKLTTLDTDEVPAPVAYPAGTNGIEAVREQIEAAGQIGVAITDSDKTLNDAMVWAAGTPRLTIINDILHAIGYWALSTDRLGRFVAEPYIRPAARPERYPLLDGVSSIYVDEFEHEQDIYSIPNRYVLIGAGSGGTEALIGSWENNNLDSRFSIPRRGYVKTTTETGIEAADQATIDAMARQRLIDASSVTASIPLTHALIPLDLNDVVRLRRVPAGIDARHTVQAMTIDLSENGLGLMQSTLREVQDL